MVKNILVIISLLFLSATHAQDSFKFELSSYTFSWIDQFNKLERVEVQKHKELISKNISKNIGKIKQTKLKNELLNYSNKVEKLIELFEFLKFENEVEGPKNIQIESKSIENFIRIKDSQRILLLNINEIEQDILNLTQQIKTNEEEVERLLKEYADSDTLQDNKLYYSIKLVARQLEILNEKLSLEVKNKTLSSKKISLEYIDKNIDEVRKHLVVTDSDYRKAIARIENHSKEYNKTFNEFKKFEEANSSNPTKQTGGFVFSQKVLSYKLRLAIVNLRVIQSKIVKKISSVLLKKKDISEPYRDWSKIIEGYYKSKEAWEQTVQNDISLSGGIILSKKDHDGINNLKKSDARQIYYLSQENFFKIQKLNKELEISSSLYDLLYYQMNGKAYSVVLSAIEKPVDLVIDFFSIFKKSLFTIGSTPVTLLGIFRVIFIMFLSVFISKLVRKSLVRIGNSNAIIAQSSMYVLGRLSHYAIIMIGIITGLSSIGVDLSSIALVAGALSVGIGFGLQAIFNNFVSGLILLFERPLKVNDYVELESGIRGEVQEINVRSTRITTQDNIDVLVPNSELINGRVINWTLEDSTRRVRIPFGVAYGTDKELVKKAAFDAAENISYTIKNDPVRKPDIWLVGFGDSSLNFELIVWVNHRISRRDRIDVLYLWELETQLHKYGIEIPFPQRDIHIRTKVDNAISHLDN